MVTYVLELNDLVGYVEMFQCISNKLQCYTVYYIWKTALHVSVGTSTHHQDCTQLYLQHLVFVTPLLLLAAIVTNTRCCRYSCMCSWWWVEVPPKTCRAVSRYNKLSNVASCWIYIGIFLRCTDPWTLDIEMSYPELRCLWMVSWKTMWFVQ
jgi:hypothetical protein